MENIIRNIKTSLIIPYDRNPRKNDTAVNDVIKSIERTGYRTPIIVDENNVVLAGHTRLKALIKMGWKEIPFVVQYTDLTEDQKREYRIRDNKSGELAEWDFEILEADFSSDELIDFGFDISEKIEKEVEIKNENNFYLSFLVNDIQREIILNRLNMIDGETQTEKLLELCRK
jgi:ParB family transcriptional regulator, chromosome partitioning protein